MKASELIEQTKRLIYRVEVGLDAGTVRMTWHPAMDMRMGALMIGCYVETRPNGSADWTWLDASNAQHRAILSRHETIPAVLRARADALDRLEVWLTGGEWPESGEALQ